ncbi:MerR family transcriptional regulator [Cellulomonas marina]|uniref:DNA-binding transcriptional regulator, MerR family n=1 Tax=Cellulomonas marina TaxID=988821 RepID=A0A1I0ZZA5_9CELL|nr:MerR family transcriptional regulator [Cellulomonas marina]GIG30559.1 MerR family transcriptional regulator [Cellulomonas marina]SFB29463.1 DNA-binding transcriptional regulator, MerR family [Cellulomonas marina]
MRISDVLAALQVEFPAVTTSKLRFWEEHGLVTPVRTPAGYRQYSPADVERLRYVLAQQRDRYLPLKVIAERLAALDAGLEDEPTPRARLATRDGDRVPTTARWTAPRLAQEAGVGAALVAELAAAGVLRADARGTYAPADAELVRAAATLAQHGIDARHLRQIRVAAERQVELVAQAVAPIRGQRSASARARAAGLAAELGELCGQVHTAVLRAAVADLTP